MVRRRARFTTPFVLTFAAACGGTQAPPQVPTAEVPPTQVTALPDAQPAVTRTDLAEFTERIGGGIELSHFNPPVPRGPAERDLDWTITHAYSTIHGEECFATPIEPCAQRPCERPLYDYACPEEPDGYTPKDLDFPFKVHQDAGSLQCFVIGSNPPQEVNCPLELLHEDD